MTQSQEPDYPDAEHVASRAELLPEEQRAGSADPEAQAEEILEESAERTDDPEGTRRESQQTPDQPLDEARLRGD